MGDVWVSSEGLRSLADVYGRHAAVVADSGPAPAVHDGFAASAAAVRAVHLDVQAAAATIAGRLTDTGAAVGDAGTGYESTDEANAVGIGAVGDGIGPLGGQ